MLHRIHLSSITKTLSEPFNSPGRCSILFAVAIVLCLVIFNAPYIDEEKHVLSASPVIINGATNFSSNVVESTEKPFSQIYAGNLWGGGNGSGDGSTLEYTKRTRALMEMMVCKYSIGLLIDAPCGGMAWMPSVLATINQTNPNFNYIGIDIVAPVIAANQIRFQNFSNINFFHFDVSSSPIKIKGAWQGTSAIFCRDALQHLSMDLVVKTLRNFARSDADFLIVGSYQQYGKNMNIKTGDVFPIDLSSPPFENLPKPLEILDEEDMAHKHLLVYSIDELSKVNFDRILENLPE